MKRLMSWTESQDETISALSLALTWWYSRQETRIEKCSVQETGLEMRRGGDCTQPTIQHHRSGAPLFWAHCKIQIGAPRFLTLAMLSASGKSVHSCGRPSHCGNAKKLMRKAPEDQIVVTGEDESCEEQFERLVAFSSNKAALRMAAGAIKDNRRDAPMDANSVWQKGETKGKSKDRKGKDHWAQDSWGKGKGKSKDKRGKNVDKKSFVRCWVYNQFGHHCDDFPIGGRPDNWQPQCSWSGAAEEKESAATASSKAKAKAKAKTAKASLAPLRTSSIRKLQFERRAGCTTRVA